MKKIATALLGATLLSAPAGASDIFGSSAGSTKDAPVTNSGGVVNWSGFYIGGQIGYGNANHNLTVNEYFKGFCYDGNLAGFDPFSDYNHGRPAKEWTLEAKNERFEQNAESCEQLDIDGDGGLFQSGDYVTVNGDSRELGSIDGLNSHGFIGGGRIGYDYARGRLLFGVFADYNFTNMETDATISGIGSFGLEKDNEWTVGGRLGYIVAPRTLAYVLVGYTQTEYDVTGLDNALIAPLFTSSHGGATFDGITVGGGIEFAMTGNIFLGLEYQHTFYGEETLIDLYNADRNQGLRVIDDLDEDKVMLTLKAKLNGGLFGGL